MMTLRKASLFYDFCLDVPEDCTLAKVALVGCVHGELSKMYDEIAHQSHGRGVDLVLCCGDFQAVRDVGELRDLHCPDKYKKLGDFPAFWRGEKVAPYLTVFVGGNHEASGNLLQLPYGGWVAHNIFYLGFSGVIRVGDSPERSLRIAGVSGIYKEQDALRGHYETLPLQPSTKISCYHMRRYEVEKLLCLREPIDVFMSHDWPRGIEKFGNLNQLLQWKAHFRKECDEGVLGNPLTRRLLDRLNIRLWAAAHLHVYYEAFYPAARRIDSGPTLPQDYEPRESEGTRFIALDKPVSHRRRFTKLLKFDLDAKRFLELSPNAELPGSEINNATNGSPRIFFDEEWVNILAVNVDTIPHSYGAVRSAVTIDPFKLRAQVDKLHSNTAEVARNYHPAELSVPVSKRRKTSGDESNITAASTGPTAPMDKESGQQTAVFSEREIAVPSPNALTKNEAAAVSSDATVVADGAVASDEALLHKSFKWPDYSDSTREYSLQTAKLVDCICASANEDLVNAAKSLDERQRGTVKVSWDIWMTENNFPSSAFPSPMLRQTRDAVAAHDSGLGVTTTSYPEELDVDL